jgi:hypothetical protein
MRAQVGQAIAASAIFAGLVVWLTWPLGARLATHLPDTRPGCRVDPLYVGWILAHESRTLVTAPFALRETNIFHPARRTFYDPR